MEVQAYPSGNGSDRGGQWLIFITSHVKTSYKFCGVRLMRRMPVNDMPGGRYTTPAGIPARAHVLHHVDLPGGISHVCRTSGRRPVVENRRAKQPEMLWIGTVRTGRAVRRRGQARQDERLRTDPDCRENSMPRKPNAEHGRMRRMKQRQMRSDGAAAAERCQALAVRKEVGEPLNDPRMIGVPTSCRSARFLSAACR